jgi:ABC-type multidrug transport system permease subunit
MISSKRKIILDKTYIKAIAVDILLGLSVGSVISLLLFLGFYRYKGAADLMEILPMFFVLIFINSPYSYLFRLVLLVPIYAPVLSILVTRPLIQNTTSRKSWIFPIFSVAATSALVAVTTTIVGSLVIGYGDGTLYLKVIAISLLFIFLGFLAGILLGYLFAPTRRIFKILIAEIASAIVGAFFEIAFLIYIVR